MLLGATIELSSILFSEVLGDATKAHSFFCPVCVSSNSDKIMSSSQSCIFIQLRRLLISIGHDVCFSIALVKAGRIFFIFRNPSPDKKVIVVT